MPPKETPNASAKGSTCQYASTWATHASASAWIASSPAGTSRRSRPRRPIQSIARPVPTRPATLSSVK